MFFIYTLFSPPLWLLIREMADESKQFTNKTNNIKLDDTNHLQWSQQVGFTIASHCLESSLDGSARVKERTTAPDGSKTLNTYFKAFTTMP